MIIQIFTEKHFFSKFWTADTRDIVNPSFFSFLRGLHTDNPLVANKYTKNTNNWRKQVFFMKNKDVDKCCE